jgi:hypothetical protein
VVGVRRIEEYTSEKREAVGEATGFMSTTSDWKQSRRLVAGDRGPGNQTVGGIHQGATQLSGGRQKVGVIFPQGCQDWHRMEEDGRGNEDRER